MNQRSRFTVIDFHQRMGEGKLHSFKNDKGEQIELKLDAIENLFTLRLSAYRKGKTSKSGSDESAESKQTSNASEAESSARTNSEKPFSWVDFNVPASTPLMLTLRVYINEGISSFLTGMFSSLQQQQVVLYSIKIKITNNN